MSSLYILEPATSGKVCLNTTVGPLDIELWARECPKACRNFVQLCLEHYYDGTIFHRVVPDFCVQGGDPTGTGSEGKSIYGAPFKDEFHQRLKFVRRGLVAMANGGPNDNGSQFFFTLGPCPDLDGKHTIFGKLAGDTLYNMLKLAECETDSNERPLYPHKIVSAEVSINPFPDIVPRKLDIKKSGDVDDKSKRSKQKSKSTAVKNFNLLSFGDEAEEEEEELKHVENTSGGVKSKSAHDILKDDEKLLGDVAVEDSELHSKSPSEQTWTEDEVKEATSTVRERMSAKALELKRSELAEDVKASTSHQTNEDLKMSNVEMDDDEFDMDYDAQANAVDKVKDEVRQMRKQLRKAKQGPTDEEEKTTPDSGVSESAGRLSLRSEQAKYKEALKDLPASKSKAREALTLKLLESFKSKLKSEKEGGSDAGSPLGPADGPHSEGSDEDDLDALDVMGTNWLRHTFKVEDEELRRAKDANVKSDDSYHIFDPRNPMNKRKREEAKNALKMKRTKES